MQRIKITRGLHSSTARPSSAISVEARDWDSFVDTLQPGVERIRKPIDNSLQKTGDIGERDGKRRNRKDGEESSKQRRKNRRVVLRGKHCNTIASDAYTG